MLKVASQALRLSLLAVFALATFATGDAGARAKGKNAPLAQAPTIVAAGPEVSLRGSFSSVPSPSSLPSPPPARFFTINEVLAKRDGRGTPASASMQLAAVDPAGTATDAAPPAVAPSRSDEPFGFTTFRAPEGVLWTKWRKVLAEIHTEAVVLNTCRGDAEDCPSPVAKRYAGMIEQAQKHEGRARLEYINRAVNSAIHYVSDIAQHGVPDLWTAPLATLAAGRGDCEDYALAKYVALREAGTPAENLRFVLVRDNAVRMDHAVLAARHDGRWLILDNRRAALLEQGDTRAFTPLFALDHNGVKFFAAPYAQRPAQQSEVGIQPAAWLEADLIALRGMATGHAAGNSSTNVAPLLM